MPKNYLLKADCLEAMRKLPDERVHAIVTDPPYGLAEIKPLHVQEALTAWVGGDREFVPATGKGFMGMRWDKFVPPPAVWDEAYRLLKPGGHMVVFAGARTYDLMGMSIRLAGFEIRDGLAWLYGQGFPKGTDIGKHDPRWTGWNTSLKPGFEPIVLARKPLGRGITVKRNVQDHGTGALNIDATRIAYGDNESIDLDRKQINFDNMGYHGAQNTGGVSIYKPGGRWPANAVLDESQAAALDEQTGILKSGKVGPNGLTDNGKATGTYGAFEGQSGREVYGDEGGASRFFYCAKATKDERIEVNGVTHPTVKPKALIRWLARLITPTEEQLGDAPWILDMFAGSGTTGVVGLEEGWNTILIENEPEYWPIIEARNFTRSAD